MERISKFIVTKSKTFVFYIMLFYILSFSIFTVRVNADDVDVRVSNCSALQTAIQQGDEKTINVATVTITSGSGDNYSGVNGIKTIEGKNNTLDGGTDSNNYGFVLDGGGKKLTISDLKMQNFKKNATSFDDKKMANGGAILVNGGSNLVFSEDVSFTNNTISGGGGSFENNGGGCGALALNEGASLEASNANLRFLYNGSGNASGGALYFNKSTVTFNSCTIEFVGNTAGDEGGAVWSYDDSFMGFDGCTVKFEGNKANVNPDGHGNVLGIGGAISMKTNSAQMQFHDTSVLSLVILQNLAEQYTIMVI
ncbi:MAG: hypothetical protein LBT18_05845 [Endomicrobium sp.]|nr:hypothetical protein [Endomicrobium sp.]